MNKVSQKPQDIDSYIQQFPSSVQSILQKIRDLVKEILPQATEIISYDIPTYKIGKHSVVYFGAWKSHIGFYNMEPKDSELLKEIKPYITSKGTIQFPLDKEIPYDLIKRLIEDRAKSV